MADAGITPSLLELIDRATMSAVEDWRRLDLDLESAALLLFQSDLPGGGPPRRDRAWPRAAARRPGRAWWSPRRTRSRADADGGPPPLLPGARAPGWHAAGGRGRPARARRRSCWRASRRSRATPGSRSPPSATPATATCTPRSSSTAPRPTSGPRALDAAGAIFEAALDLGGTITGEHGVGTLKLPWLEREIGHAPATRSRHQGRLRPAGDPQPGQGALEPANDAMATVGHGSYGAGAASITVMGPDVGRTGSAGSPPGRAGPGTPRRSALGPRPSAPAY